MSNKFEKLIEYVINDEDQKASDLFHEIVVGKSREIYESLMQDDIGGDEVDDFIDDVEADEEGIELDNNEEEEVVDMDFDNDGEADDHEEEHGDIEDRVVDLEDKLDELMAEFDELIDDGAEEEVADELEAEEELSFEESADADAELEEDESKEELEESAELEAAPKPTTSEEGSVNTKSANADDAGKKAKTDAKPVSTDTSAEKGRPAPKAQDLGVDGPEGGAKLEKAPAPKKG